MRNTRRLIVALAGCAAVVAAGVQLVTAGPSAAATTASPYSDPVWFPVHDDYYVACTGNLNGANNYATANPKGSCGSDHNGYYGLNVDASSPGAHPNIYPAGAGIVVDVTKGNPYCGGGINEVDVDHGGGVVTVYQHLDAVSVAKGQQVYPTTKLGTMGSSGVKCDGSGVAPRPYLDFQIRNNGGGYLKQTNTTVGTLKGCGADWPKDLGATKWADVPYWTYVSVSGGCYPGTVGASPTLPVSPKYTAGSGRITVSWTAITGATKYELQTQIFHPSTNSWGPPCTPTTTKGCTVGYTSVSGGSAHTAAVTGLGNGRQYRIRFSAHNANGWSAPTKWVAVMPIGTAGAPAYRKVRTTTTVSEVYWTMHVNDLHGGKVKHFEIATDVVHGSTVTPWVYHTAGAKATNFTWKTKAKSTNRVKVRVLTNAGYGAWMSVHRFTTP